MSKKTQSQKKTSEIRKPELNLGQKLLEAMLKIDWKNPPKVKV